MNIQTKVDHVVLFDENIETCAYRFKLDGIIVWVDATPEGEGQSELVDKIILACNCHDDLIEAMEGCITILHRESTSEQGFSTRRYARSIINKARIPANPTQPTPA